MNKSRPTFSRMNRRIRAFVVTACIVAGLSPLKSSAQVSVSTNTLEWFTTTINAGVEYAFDDDYSVMLDGMINPWNFHNDEHFHLWMGRLEGRRWWSEKKDGHFVGLHVLGGQYNIKNIDLPFGMLPRTEKGRHYEGWMLGVGVSYGYRWILSSRWTVEASAGIGYVYSPYKLYGRCARVLSRHDRNYVGPTRLAVSVAYHF